MSRKEANQKETYYPNSRIDCNLSYCICLWVEEMFIITKVSENVENSHKKKTKYSFRKNYDRFLKESCGTHQRNILQKQNTRNFARVEKVYIQNRNRNVISLIENSKESIKAKWVENIPKVKFLLMVLIF